VEELVIERVRSLGRLVENVKVHDLSFVLSSEVLVELESSDLALGALAVLVLSRHDGVLHLLDSFLVLGVILDVDNSGVEWAEKVSCDLGLLVRADVDALLLEGLGNLGGGGDFLGQIVQVKIVTFLSGHFLFLYLVK